MKKFVFAIGSILFLTGCSMDSVLDKVPFIQSDENAVQEEEQKLNGEVSEKINGNKEETADHGEVNENGQGNEPEKESADPKLTLEAALFNEVVQVNGKNVIQNATNTMALVNKEFALPDGYAPTDLVRPKVAFSFGDQDIEKSYLRKEAATALELMFSDAVKNGLHLFAVSGYRSYDRQKAVFDAEVNKVGYEKAVQAVAVPGNSEHQTGLSMDISSESAHFGLTEQFGETAEGKWLANHAHRFGFVQRYPKGKEGITGYQYESWHYRYVGVKAATEIFENQLTLEEYFNLVEKI
jgi:D-alanyl-D-alanine carboxypeptidase